MQNKIAEALVNLTEYKDKNVYVSFSGGKDSLVVLDLALRVGISNVVFCDTTLEFDETLEYIEKIESFYGIDIKTIKAPSNFFDLVDRICIPSRKCRWCCKVFKFGPLAQFGFDNNIYGYITGLRNEESNSRKNYQIIDLNPSVPTKQVNPILTWGEKDVWKYIKNENLSVNPLYQFFNRIGCWICPYRTKKEWEITKVHFPEKYEILVNLLNSYAIKNNIEDKNNFIGNMRWTCWAHTNAKISAGTYKFHYNADGILRDVDINFNADNENQINRVLKVIRIYTKDYSIINNENLLYKKIRISLENIDFKYLNILIEKAINCKGCGACLLSCPKHALRLELNELVVDELKCNQCKKCITSNILRAGCIIRNYSPKRAALVKVCS
jgi:phosphoadenosine phosphosulfate reductase